MCTTTVLFWFTHWQLHTLFSLNLTLGLHTHLPQIQLHSSEFSSHQVLHHCEYNVIRTDYGKNLLMPCVPHTTLTSRHVVLLNLLWGDPSTSPYPHSLRNPPSQYIWVTRSSLWTSFLLPLSFSYNSCATYKCLWHFAGEHLRSFLECWFPGAWWGNGDILVQGHKLPV